MEAAVNFEAVMRRENSSATNIFGFACVLSSQLPALHTEEASFLSGQHKGLSELQPTLWFVRHALVPERTRTNQSFSSHFRLGTLTGQLTGIMTFTGQMKMSLF